MRMSASVGILGVVLLLASAACQLQVHRPANQDEYFTLIWSGNYALVGYFNSKTDRSHVEPMETLFKRLATDTQLAEWGFTLLLADTAKIPMLYSHYSMTRLPNFYFFVRKQLVKCDDFAEVFGTLARFDHNAMADFGQHWIHHRLANVAVELLSLAEFEAKLSAAKIIAVYFGKRDENFRIFRNWATKYINFAFYFTFSADLAREIFASRHLSEPPTDVPFLAVIRDTELITEFDPQPIVATTRVASEEELTQFFGFERFPKLMDPVMGSNITQMLFHQNEKMILLVTSAGTPKEDIAVYHQALADLPKRMIYSEVDMNSMHIAAFMQLFMLARINMTPGKLYAIHVLPSRQVDIQEMQEGLSVANILRFVSGVIEQHAEFFGVARTDVQGKAQTTDGGAVSRDQPIDTDL